MWSFVVVVFAFLRHCVDRSLRRAATVECNSESHVTLLARVFFCRISLHRWASADHTLGRPGIIQCRMGCYEAWFSGGASVAFNLWRCNVTHCSVRGARPSEQRSETQHSRCSENADSHCDCTVKFAGICRRRPSGFIEHSVAVHRTARCWTPITRQRCRARVAQDVRIRRTGLFQHGLIFHSVWLDRSRAAGQ